MRDDVLSVESRRVPVGFEDRAIRVGMFGAGKAAQFHLDALDHLDGVELAGVCSRSGTTAHELVERHPGALATSDRAELIGSGRLDAAIVAVSHEHSAALARDLLDAHVPVLCEKPAALTAAECHELAELAAGSGTLALVAVNRRYYSLVGQAAAVVRQRGPVRGVLVEGHEPTDLLLRAGATTPAKVADWALLNSIHFVDLLRMVGGEVVDVSSVVEAVKVTGGDHVSASVRFAGGAVGTYVAHWNSGAPPSLRIYGDDVTAEVRLAPPEDAFVEFTGKRRVRLHADWSDEVAKPGVLEQDAAFLAAVSAGASSAPYPASDLADHARSLQLVEDLWR